MNKMEKLLNSLKLKEGAFVERKIGCRLSELDGVSSECEFLGALLTVARKRIEPGFKYADAEDMTLDEVSTELDKTLVQLGIEDDETPLETGNEKSTTD